MLAEFHKLATRPMEIGQTDCAMVVASCLPAHAVKLRAAASMWRAMTPAARARLYSVGALEVAETLAESIGLGPMPAGGPGWGVADTGGTTTFALYFRGRWYARGARSAVRVHPSRIIRQWEFA